MTRLLVPRGHRAPFAASLIYIRCVSLSLFRIPRSPSRSRRPPPSLPAPPAPQGRNYTVRGSRPVALPRQLPCRLAVRLSSGRQSPGGHSLVRHASGSPRPAGARLCYPRVVTRGTSRVVSPSGSSPVGAFPSGTLPVAPAPQGRDCTVRGSRPVVLPAAAPVPSSRQAALQ